MHQFHKEVDRLVEEKAPDHVRKWAEEAAEVYRKLMDTGALGADEVKELRKKRDQLYQRIVNETGMKLRHVQAQIKKAAQKRGKPKRSGPGVKDVWVDTFFGKVRVPKNLSKEKAGALAQIAWKGGVYEDQFLASFKKWFRSFAKRRPDLAEVYVPRVYPVDEFRFKGPYKSR